MRSGRFAVAAGLFCLTSGLAAAVQGTGQGPPPPPTPQKPVFTSAVDVVSVDVTVVDKYGKPVEDLGRNDFTLTVDGQPRKIASAQFVAMRRDALPSAGPALPASSLPDFSTNTVQEGKLIAIVIDRGSIAPVRARDVLVAAARFVERLDPADRVALFTIPQGPLIDFTGDHGAVSTALQHIDGQGDTKQGVKNIGVADALAFEHNNSFAIEQVFTRECGETGGSRDTGASEVQMCRNMSAGLLSTRDASPDRNRLRPLIGSIAIAPISFIVRDLPEARGSRTSQAARWNISPSAMPPSVVLMKSFSDAWLVSPKYSQVPLPNAVSADDSQKFRPLARPVV